MLPPAPPRKVMLRRRGVVVILLLAAFAEVLGLLGWGLLGPDGAGIEAGGCGCGCCGSEEVAAGDRRRRVGHEGCPCIVEDTWEVPWSEAGKEFLGLKFLPFAPMTR
jgi:hypothetical protein